MNPGKSTYRAPVCVMLHMLSEGQWSMDELAKGSGLHKSTVRLWLRDMRHKDRRTARIAAWDGRTPLFKLGSKPDAPRPKKTTAQRMQAMRDRDRLSRLYFHKPTERPQ